MRILVLHSRYRSGPVSGENRVVDDEVALLREGGHEVDLIDPTPGERAVDLARAAASGVWSRTWARRIDSLVRARRIEIVHVHNLFPALSPSVIGAADRAGAAVVMTLHNYRTFCLPGTMWRDDRACDDCLGRAPLPGVRHGCYRGPVPSAILATSLSVHRRAHTLERVRRFCAISEHVRAVHVRAGLPDDRIVVKPNFTHPAARREGAGDYALVLGRFVPEKGIAGLVASWRDLDLPLLVVGDGPDAPRIRALAGPGVEVRGPVDADAVAGLLANARVAIVPSRWEEPAGRVVLEAYAAGVPVIAHDVGALPEFVDDGVTGLVVPSGDTLAMHRAVAAMQPDRARAMGDAAFARWRDRFAPVHALRALEDVYRTARA